MIKAGGVVATRRSQPTRFAPRRVFFVVVVAVVAIPAVATASARPSSIGVRRASEASERDGLTSNGEEEDTEEVSELT